jgi:GTP-binding protein
MDLKGGLTPEDIDVAGMLRRSGKPVVYAVNKVDSTRLEPGVADFYALGAPEVIPVSAEQGRGVVELIDAVVERLPPAAEVVEVEQGIRVTILGRPNAGKSSLLNRLIGRKRAIVSNVAGTTRDPVDTPAVIDGKKYLFIDTAGIRRKNRVSMRVESYCVMEAIKTIDRADVAVLVIDGKEGLRGQDERIAGLIEDRKKCSVIVVNKWDIVEKETKTMDALKKIIAERMPFIAYAPVVFTSALTGQRVSTILDAVGHVVEMSARRVPTATLNNVIGDITYRHRPPVYRGRSIKFYYVTQTGISPPTFVLFTNYPEGVDDSYKRYITNRLRETLALDSVPLRVFFRKRH